MQNLRINRHPILDFERGQPIRFKFENTEMIAYKNETIAATLYASGVKVLRKSIRYGRPRGFFCAVGKCSQCLMTVDGIPNTRTCIMPVREGMRVEYQLAKGKIESNPSFPVETGKELETEIVVVGGGPAGLSAAITASQLSSDVLVIDENPVIGGQLIKQTHKFFGSSDTYANIRGIKIAEELLGELRKADCRYLTDASVLAIYNGTKHQLLAVQENRRMAKIVADKVVVACGAMEKSLSFENSDLPGVCGAGGVQTLMNVYGVKPGEKALMVGAGNVGLIIGYQLLQAGVDVEMVVEAMPRIGGYLVHASKLRRMGVPILTSHTIRRAFGKSCVEGAEVVKLGEDGEPVRKSVKTVDVDLICLAVGLAPSSELLSQAECESTYVAELGGYVALHNRNLQTTVDGIYVAGDSSGIEEATTAMLEGRIAGATATADLGRDGIKLQRIREEAHRQLKLFRMSPFSEKVKKGKEKVWSQMRERE